MADNENEKSESKVSVNSTTDTPPDETPPVKKEGYLEEALEQTSE